MGWQERFAVFGGCKFSLNDLLDISQQDRANNGAKHIQ